MTTAHTTEHVRECYASALSMSQLPSPTRSTKAQNGFSTHQVQENGWAQVLIQRYFNLRSGPPYQLLYAGLSAPGVQTDVLSSKRPCALALRSVHTDGDLWGSQKTNSVQRSSTACTVGPYLPCSPHTGVLLRALAPQSLPGIQSHCPSPPQCESQAPGQRSPGSPLPVCPGILLPPLSPTVLQEQVPSPIFLPLVSPHALGLSAMWAISKVYVTIVPFFPSSRSKTPSANWIFHIWSDMFEVELSLTGSFTECPLWAK